MSIFYILFWQKWVTAARPLDLVMSAAGNPLESLFIIWLVFFSLFSVLQLSICFVFLEHFELEALIVTQKTQSVSQNKT